MRISEFEWNDGNILHLALHHGIEPEEAEEVFAITPRCEWGGEEDPGGGTPEGERRVSRFSLPAS